MSEVLYVVDFEAQGSDGLLELEGTPLLVLRQLMGNAPDAGDLMPDWPHGAAPVHVRVVERTLRPGSVVAWGSVTLENPGIYYRLVPGEDDETPGGQGERAEVTTFGGQALAMIAEAAAAQGWEIVGRLANITPAGEGGITTGVPAHDLSARQLLAAGAVLDEVEVVYCRKEDLDDRLVLRFRGGEMLEGVFDLGGWGLSTGMLGRLGVDGFVPYVDQSLRRVPELDTEQALGWRCEAKPGGFTAPRSVVPGRGGAFVPAGEPLELRVPPEFAALCAAKAVSARQVLEAFMADVADLVHRDELPREDGLISGETGLAQSYFQRVWH